MSMSTFLTGFRKPDEKFQKMKTAWEACKAAGIEPPEEIDKFFDGDSPESHGLPITLAANDKVYAHDGSVRLYREDCKDGFVVDLDNLPQDIRVLKFHNSY